jgi:hypothetical protein
MILAYYIAGILETACLHNIFTVQYEINRSLVRHRLDKTVIFRCIFEKKGMKASTGVS